jgi:hypothetical protein
MGETNSLKNETSAAGGSQETPVRPDPAAAAFSLIEDERPMADKIKKVYGELGRILDVKRREKFRREKDDVTRLAWLIRAVYGSWILWLLIFAISPRIVADWRAQLLLMVNALALVGLYVFKAFSLLKVKRKSAQERMEEDGEKAALEMLFAKRILLAADAGPVLKEVELKQKSDLSLIDSRFVAVTNFLRNLIPGVASLVVLFGLPNPAANTDIGRIFALAGAILTLIITTVETVTQRYITEKKECIAMLEQAQMKPE